MSFAAQRPVPGHQVPLEQCILGAFKASQIQLLGGDGVTQIVWDP